MTGAMWQDRCVENVLPEGYLLSHVLVLEFSLRAWELDRGISEKSLNTAKNAEHSQGYKQPPYPNNLEVLVQISTCNLKPQSRPEPSSSMPNPFTIPTRHYPVGAVRLIYVSSCSNDVSLVY